MEGKRLYKIEVYRGQDWFGRASYFWHIKAPNGRVVADSAESYSSRGNALRSVNRLLKQIREMGIETELG